MNSPVVLNLLGESSTGPNPPALLTVNQSSARPTISRNGAPTPSSTRMVSMPFHTTHMLISQNPKKQTQIPEGMLAVEGHTIFPSRKLVFPPTQVWFPNNPTPPKTPKTAGRFAP